MLTPWNSMDIYIKWIAILSQLKDLDKIKFKLHNADATKFVLAAMGQYKKQSQLLNYDPYRYDLKGVEEKENANVCTSHAVNEITIMLYHTLL